MNPAVLLTDVWVFEGRSVARAVCLCEQLVLELFINREPGRCVDSTGKELIIEIEEFKGPTEVWYSDDGERHIFIAGEPIGSGESYARNLATNATVVEIHGDCPSSPAVYTADREAVYGFAQLRATKLINKLSDIPFYAANQRVHCAGVAAVAEALVPDELKSRLPSNRKDEFGKYLISSTDWIPFNRICMDKEWQRCVGAVRFSDDNVVQLVLQNKSSKIVAPGAMIGAAAGSAVKTYCCIQ
jgi:hypothetical protein